MKRKITCLLFAFFAIVSCGKRNYLNSYGTQDLSLAGAWEFKDDPSDVGIAQKWYLEKRDEMIMLPGSMTSNNKGEEIRLDTEWTGSIFDSSYFVKPEYHEYRQEGSIKVPFWLQPVKYYVGAAWYQKEINLTKELAGKRLQLVLERPHRETTVWVDGNLIGTQNSLSTEHRYDLGNKLTTGKHRIAVRVDNRIKDINPGQNSHSISDHTQTNWNGIAGQIYLREVPEVSIDHVRLYPDVQTKKVRVVINLINKSGSSEKLHFKLLANQISGGNTTIPTIEWNEHITGDSAVIEKLYDMGSDAALWDEFSPNLYALKVSISGDKIGSQISTTTFGFREVGVSGTNVAINGRAVFLRGALECAIFPLTGYPATDAASWTKIFKVARSYGLNHIRFHSWCPPEAAFDAADRAGFYLQVECGSWPNWGTSLGDGQKIDSYLYEESERIVKAYGNHPSFIMLTHGNEPGGKNRDAYLAKFVTYWKNKDERRLYTAGAGWPVIKENDFENISDPRIQQWEQGLKSIINAKPPQTLYDWSAIINKHKTPVVSHEIGQWCVYPDFKEIAKYTGVLKAKNFEIFADRLKESGLYHLADSFLLASGKLQVLCYKADIEASLRTKGMAGFQLLGLQDFPGQGTALVGVVNPFWEDKGYVTPAEYSSFSNTVVPLARFEKMNLVNTETLRIPVELANFGYKPLENTTLEWTISDARGAVLFTGNLPAKTFAIGNGLEAGLIEQPLASIKMAQKLVLTVNAAGFKNSWDFFVYPAALPKASTDILVTSKLDNNALAKLNSGGKVLLTFPKASIALSKGGNIAVGFSSIFWNTAWTNGQAPHTLGIFCDPKHPALSNFPADYHSNWQWWDAMSHSNV
ncbi:beta-galactosidase, partial [Pontibacter qinzhouensis]